MVNYGGAAYVGSYGGGYGAMGHGGAYGGFAAHKGEMQPPPGRKRRLNIIAVCLNLFVPWLVFCLVGAMLSFEMHYTKPEACQTYLILILVAMILMGVLDLAYIFWRRSRGETSVATPSWLLFLCITSLVALGVAVAFGNRNFWENTQVFFDVTALNSYNAVDPARMKGQELMDAGRVRFVNGTHLDLRLSMGFKNVETYCVAPIAGGSVVGNPPLSVYDFWAVGKDCCSGSASDFRCGDFDDPTARAGVRLVRDSDRAFFRLAVQQAESVHHIKAVHPLFFHWVRDPVAETNDYQQRAFKQYTIGMFAYFGFQIFLVFIAANVFARFA